jgi:acyl-CoA thioesterase FadM
MHEVAVMLPRSAFSPREAARAGDVWRLFQDVAVGGSIQAGWPPARYRAEGVSFVVRSMTVFHHRETLYGEALTGRTWPSRFRRGLFFRRECRVHSDGGVSAGGAALGAPEVAGGAVASATQEWVHVSAGLELVRASEALVASFPVEDHEPPVELPTYAPIEAARTHLFEFDCWHTWMDPLDHVNHPAYVDFCDEATSRVMVSAGLDPVRLAPVAEEATFRSGVRAAEGVVVSTRLAGRTLEGAAVLEHEVSVGERLCARLVSVRRLAGEVGPSALLDALR